MKHFWENDGEANASGDFVAVIDLEDGGGVQRFIDKSHKAVADKLLQAQANATVKIREQNHKLAISETPDPATATPEFKRRPLTADERFEIGNSMTDPTKAPEAIRTVVEAELGAPLEVVRTRLNTENEDTRAKDAYAAGRAFVEATPEYLECPHNANTLAKWMQMHGMAPTAKNFTIAFAQLREAGLVLMKPTEEPTNEGETSQPDSSQPAGVLPAKATVTTRPRATVSSTGIRSADSSGVPERRTTATKYTREQIDAMPMETYKHKLLHEPGFAKLIDSL